MLTKKEVYELLAQEAQRTGRAGTERVTVQIPKEEFDTEYHYRASLAWEIEDGVVYVSDNAR